MEVLTYLGPEEMSRLRSITATLSACYVVSEALNVLVSLGIPKFTALVHRRLR